MIFSDQKSVLTICHEFFFSEFATHTVPVLEKCERQNDIFLASIITSSKSTVFKQLAEAVS